MEGSAPRRSQARRGRATARRRHRPALVPSVWRLFVADRHPDHLRAVQVLGQIDCRDASRALAALAVFSRSDEARRQAAEVLRRRDPREFADLLIAQLREPIEYEVQPVNGPGSTGRLTLKNQQANVHRLYRPPGFPNLAQIPFQGITYDQNGLPILHRLGGYSTSTGRIPADQILRQMGGGEIARANLDAFTSNPALGAAGPLLNETFSNGLNTSGFAAEVARTTKREHTTPDRIGYGITQFVQRDVQIPYGQMVLQAQRAAAVAEQQLESDVAAIEAHNTPIREVNNRSLGVLRAVSGLDLPAEPEPWMRWYYDQLGYTLRTPSSTTPRSFVVDVPLAYVPRPVPVAVVDTPSMVLNYTRMSCFAAGTPVHTQKGLRPIEHLQVGDLVLCQDTTSVALSYQPVLVTHHNPPAETFRVHLDDQTIVASAFHRFWKAGHGWVMARDLKPGDTLRTLDGLRSVAAVEPGPVQPVFNLDVAVGRSFFVGKQGALVHDNSVPDLRAEPFDRPAVLARAEAATP